MNTRIEKDFLCQTAIHFNNEFLTNAYSLTLSMLVEECSDESEPNIAMDRIAYYLDTCIQNSLLIDQSETTVIEKYKLAGIRTCELPGPPHDQLFAAVLLLKLNAIMEGRMKITDLMIGSALSDGVRYNIVAEVAESSLPGNYWWNKACITTNNDDNCPGDNVVRLFEEDPWEEMGFSWHTSEAS